MEWDKRRLHGRYPFQRYQFTSITYGGRFKCISSVRLSMPPTLFSFQHTYFIVTPTFVLPQAKHYHCILSFTFIRTSHKRLTCHWYSKLEKISVFGSQTNDEEYFVYVSYGRATEKISEARIAL